MTTHTTTHGATDSMHAGDVFATSVADEHDAEDARVFNAAGGDWDDIVDEASALHEERIVVNMGPQHPSTHGVLRLILELDGETVTETRAGIGYLHTGIEKNMEYRNWTQGVTFCTRMDYLAPLFNEAVYCLGVEKLLGITDQIPERATTIRVLLMELNRIGSHLVALATGGMEMGATTVMTVGFRERERILAILEMITGLRMNHAFIRPGGVAQDLPAGRHRQDPRHDPRRCAGPARARAAAGREPHPQGPHGRRRLPRPDRLHVPRASPGRSCAPPACRTTCASSRRTAATRPTSSTSPPATPATPTGGCGSASTRCTSRCGSSSRRSTGCRPTPGPVMVEDKKIAWPAQLAIGGDGMGNSLDHIREIMGTSMESLIHHFKLVTEGFRVPPGQAYAAIESPKGELGCHVVSDGGTRPYRAHFRDPSFNNLQAMAAMCEGSQVADVIVAVASIDPVMGGVDR